MAAQDPSAGGEKHDISAISTEMKGKESAGAESQGLLDDHRRNLRTFQELVGIRTPSNILDPYAVDIESNSSASSTPASQKQTNTNATTAPHPLPRRARSTFKSLLYPRQTTNKGYYQSAINEELKARIGFQMSSTCINLIYIAQIFFAATITALAGSENRHRTTLTILGAINTVLAGLMAYIKGMGLPNRLLRSRDQFHHVIEYAEYQERKFSEYMYLPAEVRATLDPQKAADDVRDLYEAAKKDQQDNYPDIYLNNHERATVERIIETNRTGAKEFAQTTPQEVSEAAAEAAAEAKARADAAAAYAKSKADAAAAKDDRLRQ